MGECNLSEFTAEAVVIDYGMILICRGGKAMLRVNFDEWQLHEGAVITLFPNDMVQLSEASADFSVAYLRYDESMLREASLQLEQTVYSQLRQDRCRTESPVVTNIINAMFALLKTYFVQKGCMCLDQLVVLQLKSFFLGFYDYLERFPSERHVELGSRRMRELFNQFMMLLERDYRLSRDVSYYASLMHISPKYLNTVTHSIAHNNVKTIIDHYVVLQLKLTLGNSRLSAKEIAWQYNFSDQSFFCKYFKMHTGMTPQTFRLQLRDKPLLEGDRR